MAYKFISTGGCPKCDAMAGTYDTMPARPHHRCDCLIHPVERPTPCFEVVYNNVEVTNEFLDDESGYMMYDITISYTIKCVRSDKSKSYTEFKVLYGKNVTSIEVPGMQNIVIPDYSHIDKQIKQSREAEAFELCNCDRKSKLQ